MRVSRAQMDALCQMVDTGRPVHMTPETRLALFDKGLILNILWPEPTDAGRTLVEEHRAKVEAATKRRLAIKQALTARPLKWWCEALGQLRVRRSTIRRWMRGLGPDPSEQQRRAICAVAIFGGSQAIA